MSVVASSSGVRQRIRDDVDRDVSDADDGHPLLREIERAVPIVGWPLYQATNSVAGWLPAQVLSGMPMRRSVWAPVQYTIW